MVNFISNSLFAENGGRQSDFPGGGNLIFQIDAYHAGCGFPGII
jgi:hypothetical protein